MGVRISPPRPAGQLYQTIRRGCKTREVLIRPLASDRCSRLGAVPSAPTTLDFSTELFYNYIEWNLRARGAIVTQMKKYKKHKRIRWKKKYDYAILFMAITGAIITWNVLFFWIYGK